MSQPQAQKSSRRFVVHDLTKQNGHTNFERDVRTGLSANPKQLFPKYLYDELGSRLFEAISRLDEYYLTRAEDQILSSHTQDIVATLPGCQTLIELGSGNAQKTRTIIEALIRAQGNLLFIPIDISASALTESSQALVDAYPTLTIDAYAADYFDALEALPPLSADPALVLFLGSNIGNFEPAEARDFLSAIRRVLRPQDALLLGADLKKDARTLEAAYNDPLGVTRSFIVNQLERINRELEADFDLWAFGLRSVYNESASRVEVYLESLRPQSVCIRGLDMCVRFDGGERIHVENAYKYDVESLRRLGHESGLVLDRTWFDKKNRFSSNLFRVAEN